MTTKAQALKAIRAINPKYTLRVRPDAPSKAQREANAATRRACNLRMQEIIKELDAPRFKDHVKKLRDAARFVVDVDGDEPSIPQLATALAISTEHADLTREYSDKRHERDSQDSYRFRFGMVDATGFGIHIHIEADTLDELVEKIKAKKTGLTA